MPRGSGRLPYQPGQAVKGAAGCTEGSETLGPCVSALELPLLGGPEGPCVLLPLSLCAALFLCCQMGRSALSGSARGRGQGSCCPVPSAPSLGMVDTQVPCIEPFSPCPRLASPGPSQVSSCLNSFQAAVGGGTSLPTASVGTDRDPATSTWEGGQEGRASVTTCEGSKGLSFRTWSPASLGSVAEGRPPHHPSPDPSCLLGPPKALGLGSPGSKCGDIGRTLLWCHINMYMCI